MAEGNFKLFMALKDSAEALILYLNRVEAQGVYNSLHGEILLVKPQELDKYTNAVVNDLLELNNAKVIKIHAGKPVLKKKKSPPPVFVSAVSKITGTGATM